MNAQAANIISCASPPRRATPPAGVDRARMRRHFDDRLGRLWVATTCCTAACPAPTPLPEQQRLSLPARRAGAGVAQARTLLRGERELLMSTVFQHGDTPQRRAERRPAALMQAEDGLIAQSGWAANVGSVQCIAGPVYIDMNGHASLWEGITAAGAQAVPIRHNDVDHLRRRWNAWDRA